MRPSTFSPLAGVIVAVLALLLSTPAFAGLVSVDTSQDRIAVSATGPSTVTVTWLVVRDFGSLPNPSTISSPSGRFLVNGAVVGTINRTLSRFVPGTVFGQQTLIFTEAVTVPQAAVFRAIKARAPIVFERTFSTTGTIVGGLPTSLSGSLNLNPSGPGSEPFSVSRLSLRFDDQSRVKVLPKNGRLRAVAELNTTGQGFLQGIWEFASGATSAGTPVFQTLSLVRQPVAFGGRMVITSPPLPTRFEGTNLVRLRITEPETFFDEPELQYYVTPESPLPEDQPPGLMLVTAPEPGTPLTLTTRFAWQAVPGAEIYKVEIFAAPPGPAAVADGSEVVTPVPLDRVPDTTAVDAQRALTGSVVPGTQTEIRLQDYSLAHLPGNRRYLWTVKAIGPEGVLLGVSPPREIYKP